MDKKFMIFGLVAIVLVISLNAGATFFITNHIIEKNAEAAAAAAETEGEDGEKKETRPPLYVELEPFVVNFLQGDSLRYLQMNVQIMSREQTVIDEITSNKPQIRNSLILLLSNQSYEELATREGKETIRTMIHDEVNTILDQEDAVESVYLTGFVMQ